MVIDAILPAGGKAKPEFAKAMGTDVKALASFNGTTFLESVLTSIKSTPEIRKTVVIGGPEVQAALQNEATNFLQEGTSGPDNIFKGLDFLLKSDDPPSHVLIATTDLPFLQPSHIQWLLQKSESQEYGGKEIYVPVVRKDDFLELYPGCPSTFVNLTDEILTLGGIFLVEVNALKKAQPHIEGVYQNRKSVFGMGKLIGIGFAIKLIFKKLSLADVQNKLQSILQCTGVAIPGAPAELAYDVDDNEDYIYGLEWAKTHLEKVK